MRSIIQILAAFALVLPAFAESSTTLIAETPTGQQEVAPALSEIYISGEGVRSIEPLRSLNSLQQLAEDLMVAGAGRVLLVFYPVGESPSDANRLVLTDRVVVEGSEASAQAIAAAEGVEQVDRLDFAPGHYSVKVRNSAKTIEKSSEFKGLPGVKRSEPEFAKALEKRASPNDPLFPQQWHLDNTGQFDGLPGIDVNVTNVWDTFRGTGIAISIVDDAVELSHEEINSRAIPGMSFDFNDNDSDPSPVDGQDDFHGTACAGVAAASGFNGTGVVGVAPSAGLAGIRLISEPVGDSVIAQAMALGSPGVHIKSNSWGPEDRYVGPGSLTRSALLNESNQGRNGYGTIFLFAAGNSAQTGDRADYDGYVNSPYVIGVGAIADDGVPAIYSEPGSSVLISAPSSGSTGNQRITTTDLTGTKGYNSQQPNGIEPADTNYTGSFGGTSAACPAVAGVVALMLEANPMLRWYHVQDILVRTAKRSGVFDQWTTNGAGLRFGFQSGAGLVDAEAAVASALTYNTNIERSTTTVDFQGLPEDIPANDPVGVTIPVQVNSGITSLFSVTLDINITHTYRGDLVVQLISPSGTVSTFTQVAGDSANNIQWTFKSVVNWGEDPNGEWKLVVVDAVSLDFGKIQSARLVLSGTSVGGSTSQPPSSVELDIVNPDSPMRRMRSGSRIDLSGTAAQTSGIEKVEYALMYFGSTPGDGPEVPVNGNSLADSVRWVRANGTETWNFDARIRKGINRILVRALAKDGEYSNLQGVTVLGE